jgi:hypothetical protein
VDAVREGLAEYQRIGIHGAVIDAEGVVMRAALDALEGRRDAAVALYRDALRRYRDLGLRWREALAVIDMATLLGPGEPEVARAAAPARELLAGVGAAPLLARLGSALETTDPTLPPSPAASGRAALQTPGRT